jgi:hypothetical protein
MLKGMYATARTDFDDAVREIPSGGDLLGMALVDGITSGLSMASKLASLPSKLMRRARRRVMDAYKSHKADTSEETPKSPSTSTDVPDGDVIDPEEANDDPAMTALGKILTSALTVEAMLGPANGKPDWVMISGKPPVSNSHTDTATMIGAHASIVQDWGNVDEVSAEDATGAT